MKTVSLFMAVKGSSYAIGCTKGRVEKKIDAMNKRLPTGKQAGVWVPKLVLRVPERADAKAMMHEWQEKGRTASLQELHAFGVRMAGERGALIARDKATERALNEVAKGLLKTATQTPQAPAKERTAWFRRSGKKSGYLEK